MEKIFQTRLWAMLHNPESAADVIAMFGQTVILSEFAKELHGYCRKVENLAERMRALRSLRIGIVATRQPWTQTEAGEKCSNRFSRRPSCRAYRLRVRNHPNGVGRAVCHGL